MIIHNGDHAEFERKHANTPLEQRPDWPLPSFDASDWAKAFCKIHPDVREDDAATWFANALMRGFDEHASRVAALESSSEATPTGAAEATIIKIARMISKHEGVSRRGQAMTETTPTKGQIAEVLRRLRERQVPTEPYPFGSMSDPDCADGADLIETLAAQLAGARGQLRYQRMLTEQIQASHDLAATAVAEALKALNASKLRPEDTDEGLGYDDFKGKPTPPHSTNSEAEHE